MKFQLKKLIVVIVIIVGLIEYIKIGQSLVNGTYTKAFITVSPFSKGAGEKDSLPPEILEIKTLSERNKLTTFNLQFSSKDEPNVLLFNARALEFLYPIKMNASSKFIFLIGEQEILNGCRALDQLQLVTLYECTD